MFPFVVKTLNLEIFTLAFSKLSQRILLKCVPHVQHDYFSSFNQSGHCFLASSLPLPSSCLNTLNGRFTRYDFCRVRQAYGRSTTRLTIDLFSLYILFSHFRPPDATRGNSFFQMSSYARANLRINNEKTKGKFP